jgi:uncharacterized protein YukE
LTTRHTPQEFKNTAQKHRDTSDSVRRQQDDVTTIVGTFGSKNSSDTVRRFNALHDHWDQQVTDIRGKLGDMADYMEFVSNHLIELEQGNVGELPPPPPPVY